jgi:hypothetical protein
VKCGSYQDRIALVFERFREALAGPVNLVDPFLLILTIGAMAISVRNGLAPFKAARNATLIYLSWTLVSAKLFGSYFSAYLLMGCFVLVTLPLGGKVPPDLGAWQGWLIAASSGLIAFGIVAALTVLLTEGLCKLKRNWP